MHASHVAALVLAASAASPALSVPLAPRGVHATSDVVTRDAVDDIATKVLQLFSGKIVTRDLGRDDVNFVREIFRRQCGTRLLAGNQTFPTPIGACDLEAIINSIQNFQRDVASRSLNSLD